MIDIYTSIAVGIALLFGLPPLIKQIIKPDSDFLITYCIDKTKFEEYKKQLKENGDWIE